jgi:hypothetical protein
MCWPKDNIATHSRRQIDDDVSIRRSNPLHHFSVKMHGPIWRTGLGIADVTMHHRGTRFGRVNRRCSDLLRAAWHFVTAILSASRTRQGGSNKDFISHLQWHWFPSLSVAIFTIPASIPGMSMKVVS